MQSTNIPTKIPVPFANSASSTYKNTIPTASQIGITNGKASLTDGFPPLTFQAISSGGVPPFGADFNGILYEITSITQWQQAGGFFPYDSYFSSTIGGYPKGAIVLSSSLGGLWLNFIENNASNPDTGGTGWTPLAFFPGQQPITISSTTTTLTSLQTAYPILFLTGTLTANSTIYVPQLAREWIVVNQTNGSYTLTMAISGGLGVTLTQGQNTFVYTDGSSGVYFADSAKVASFNGRVGTVSLNATDVTSALGYTPYNSSNPAGYLSSAVTTFNTRSGAVTLTGLDVTNALTFTPYNSSNPSGYITVPTGLGWNGTSYHDFTSSKTVGTTYTNSYGYPIFLEISTNAGGGGATSINVNGSQIAYMNSVSAPPYGAYVCAIIPTGTTYSVSSNGYITQWTEIY